MTAGPDRRTGEVLAALVEDLFGVPADTLDDRTELQEGLQLDSLSVVELQVAIEDALGVRFADAPAAGAGSSDPSSELVTFGDLVAVVDRLRTRR